MALFDERRKQLGLTPKSSVETSRNQPQRSSGGISAFERRRAALQQEKETRRQESIKQTRQVPTTVIPEQSFNQPAQTLDNAGIMQHRIGAIQNFKAPEPVEVTTRQGERKKTQWEEDYPKITKALETVAKPVDWFFNETKPGQFIDRASETLATRVTPDTPYFDMENSRPGDVKFLDGPTPREYLQQQHNAPPNKVADFIGETASYVAPVTGMPGGGPLGLYRAPLTQTIAQGVGRSAIGRVGSNLVGKANQALNPYGINLGPNLVNRMAQEATREAIVGTPMVMQHAALQGKTSAEDQAKAAVEGSVYGALTGGALPVVGQALKNTKLGKAFSSFLNRNQTTQPPQQTDVLALPMGRADAARMRSMNAPGTEAIVNPYTFALPEPNVLPPTSARSVRQPGLNAVLERIQPLVNERMTPPYENPNELAKWIHKNLGMDDLSLNEVRRLSYEDMRLMSDEMRKRMNVYDTAVTVAREQGFDLDRMLNQRKIAPNALQRGRETLGMREAAGVPPLVRSAADRYPQGTMSEAAPLQTKVGRAPLQFKPEQAASRPVLRMAQEVPAQPAPPNLARQNIDASLPSRPSQQLDDIADDIEVPEPDQVAPRIRDRVNSLADDLINSAKAEIARNRNRLSSNPIDIYGQGAKLVAGYMLKGTVKLADVTEALIRDLGEEIRPYVKEMFKRGKEQYKLIQKQVESEELGLTGFEAQELKDLTNLNLNTADVYRNFRKVFGKHFPAIKKAVLDPFDEAKGSYAQDQKAMTDRLYKDVVRGLGIRKGSKESALVQRYGEGQIDLDQLKAEAPKNWQKIVQADMWFRNEYDRLITKVNESVKRIYPNRPEKLVPFRADYYRHFQEMKGWGGLVNLFDTTSAKISPSLSGTSPFTQPKTKWASFKQKRGLGEFTNDAVGGFLDYIPSASYAIHIDPHISVFRNLAKRLASDTEQTANINNFIKFLNNFSNDLAGKTSPIDRWVEEIGGRNALRVMTRINNRVKSNVILGNVRSTLSQLASIPNGIAFGGIDSPAGAIRTVQSLFVPNEAMSKSRFMRERYLDKSFRRFDQKFWEQPRRFAEWMMETTDRVGTSFVWNAAYARGLRLKVADPVRFADENTRSLVGGRGVGEQPLLIKSKVFNLVSPFQLEVNNLWRVMKDFVDEKRFGALATLFAANWLLNKAFEKTTGSGVVFDPIDALWDAATMEDASVLQRGGRVAGEVLSSLPFGQTLASLYPEYGTNMYGIELPSRKELFGEKDPTRFGTGLLAAGAITDPLFKFVLPFGGNQAKKTIQGLDALLRQGSFTENVLTTGKMIKEPKLKFPVEANPTDVTRGVLFGPYATSQGQEYTKNDRRALSAKQTEKYLKSRNPQLYYDDLMSKRRENTEKLKAKKNAP